MLPRALPFLIATVLLLTLAGCNLPPPQPSPYPPPKDLGSG